MTAFNIGDEVCVGLGTSPANIISLLPNNHAKIKWQDKAYAKWENVYPLSKLNKVTETRRRRSKPPASYLEEEHEQEAPPKKMKSNDGIMDSTSKKRDEPSKEPSKTTVSPETVVSADKSVALASIDDSNVVVETDSAFLAKPKTTHAVPDLWEVAGVEKDKGLNDIAKLLPKGLKPCKQDVAHFFLFVYERQMVWERRNQGEWQPYTKSLAMQEYFFCNVSVDGAMSIVFTESIRLHL